MRLDKYLAESGLGTRSEVKTLIKKGRVAVNGSLVRSDKFQLDANHDLVSCDGRPVHHQTLFYYLMNKPAGLVSVTRDNQHKTVLALLSPEDYRADLFPAGRLDKDTEGLLFLTNDGDLAHRLLSPAKHVEKEYFARVKGLVSADSVQTFADGLVLNNEKGLFTGTLQMISVDESAQTSEIRLIIHRGVYHQVKRMFAAVGMRVTYLKRLRIGNLLLPEDLPLGAYRELTGEELAELKKSVSAR